MVSSSRGEFLQEEEERVKDILQRDLTSVQRKSSERELATIQRSIGKEPEVGGLKVVRGSPSSQKKTQPEVSKQKELVGPPPELVGPPRPKIVGPEISQRLLNLRRSRILRSTQVPTLTKIQQPNSLPRKMDTISPSPMLGDKSSFGISPTMAYKTQITTTIKRDTIKEDSGDRNKNVSLSTTTVKTSDRPYSEIQAERFQQEMAVKEMKKTQEKVFPFTTAMEKWKVWEKIEDLPSGEHVSKFGKGIFGDFTGIAESPITVFETVKGLKERAGQVGTKQTYEEFKESAKMIPSAFVEIIKEDPVGFTERFLGGMVGGMIAGKMFQLTGKVTGGIKRGQVDIPIDGGTRKIYSGIYYKRGKHAQPLISKVDGKIIFGNVFPDDLPLEGFKHKNYIPKTPLETKLLTNKGIFEKLGFEDPPLESSKVSTVTDIMKFTEKQKSIFIKDQFPKKIKTLSEKGVKEVLKFSKENIEDIDVLYGSFATDPQLKPGTGRTPGDIDIQLKVDPDSAIDFTHKLAKRLDVIGEQVRISKDTPTLIETMGKDSKWHHAVDIHHIGEKADDVLQPTVEGAYGFDFGQKSIKTDDLPVMRLSEQGLRKGSSILAWQEKTLGPKPHRIKDIGDFYVTQKTLLESKKMNTIFGGKKSDTMFGKLESVKKLYPDFDWSNGRSSNVIFEFPLKSDRVSSGRPSSPLTGSFLSSLSATSPSIPSASLSIPSGPSPSPSPRSPSPRSSPSASLSIPSIPPSPSPRARPSKPSPSLSIPLIPSPGTPPSLSIPSIPLIPSSPSRPRSPSRPSPSLSIPLIPSPGTPSKRREKRKYSRKRSFNYYDVFVKRRGKFFKVTRRPLLVKSALGLGGSIVGGTPSATFKLEKSHRKGILGKKSKFESDKFYKKKGKKGLFIEKRRYRIDTPGEVAGIPKKAHSKRGSWHTRREKKLVKKFGGVHRKHYGVDGRRRGRPIEVRSQRKDNRFRLQKDIHQQLIRQNGNYIFDSSGRKPKMVSAKKVSKMLPRGKWYKDRKYPHKFVTKKDIWGRKG